MYISKTVRDILRAKLNFNENQISIMNDSLPLSAKVLGYVQIIQSDTVDRKAKLDAVNKLQKIRVDLTGMQSPTRTVLEKAYEEFYSFKRFKAA